MIRDPFEAPDNGGVPDEPDPPDDEPSLPMFGCACENALVIDRVCRACKVAMGYIPLTDGGGYRRQRRRMGYRFFPSPQKLRERLNLIRGRVVAPIRCDECGALLDDCPCPPF